MTKNKNKSDLLALVLMVKNESASIEATLASFFEGGIRNFFVFDTGSTDDTLELAKCFFQKRPVQADVQQEPFIDFASSRNRALELAEQRFEGVPFLLMPDAEWFLHGGKELLDFCAQEEFSETGQYLISMKMTRTTFYMPRLFRTSSKVRFKGVVHESPEAPAVLVRAPSSVYLEVRATQSGVAKSQKRWFRDLKLLFAAHVDNPSDPRTAFYLAQTYECLQDLKNAYAMYQVREQLQGWDEENFITLLRLGRLAEAQHKEAPELGWAMAMDYYLKAFALRPQRIEPLISIAEHFWPSNAAACYLFVRHAYDLPYPREDVLFVEKELYEYSRYEIMSRCAWHVGEFVLGEQATRLALNARPNTPHLLNNLQLYEQKNAIKAPVSDTVLQAQYT